MAESQKKVERLESEKCHLNNELDRYKTLVEELRKPVEARKLSFSGSMRACHGDSDRGPCLCGRERADVKARRQLREAAEKYQWN